MTAPNSTRITRLKAAGWIHIDGWVPPGYKQRAAQRWIDKNAAEAERIATAPGKRGRPKQGAGK